MDNLTHSLVGLTAAKAGLEKLSPGATLLCLIAANGPDGDILVLPFGDRWTYLHHHRGITHAIAGVICIALFLPLLFYAVDWLWSRFRNRAPQVNLKGLMLISFIVSATHPLLDYTNNYGIRPFLPWDPKWIYGDFVFIVDPYLWLILGGACFLLSAKTIAGKIIWGVVASIITFLLVFNPRSSSMPNFQAIALIWIVGLAALIILFVKGAGRRWGRKIAFVAFAAMLCHWGFLKFQHSRAFAYANEEAAQLVSPYGETVGRLAAMPTLANPFRWDCAFETDRATYRFNFGLGDEAPPSKIIRYPKPPPDLKEKVVEQRPGRIFLGFARFPVMRLEYPGCTSQTLVQLADLRYTEPGSSRGTFALELSVDCPEEQ